MREADFISSGFAMRLAHLVDSSPIQRRVALSLTL
jgi:hypothetical protein